MPFIEPACAHLIEHLLDVGPTMAGEVVSYQELAAWAEFTGHRLSGWEASTLRQLSAAWLAEYDAASDPKRPAPFTPVEVDAVDHAAISKARLEMWKRMAGEDEAKAAEQPRRVTKRPSRA